jgi:hypothetical protein
VRWLNDGTGVVDQYVNMTSRFNAWLNEARDIPTTGEVRLDHNCLDSFVQNRSNRLTCAIVGVKIVHRYMRALLAQSHSHFLADAAISTGHKGVEASQTFCRHLSPSRPRR